MIYEVRLAPRAWRDLARLADFLASRSPRAEAKARAALWAAIKSLHRFPDRGAPASVEPVRILFVPFGRGGYVIEYLVEASDVSILRIFHSREER